MDSSPRQFTEKSRKKISYSSLVSVHLVDRQAQQHGEDADDNTHRRDEDRVVHTHESFSQTVRLSEGLRHQDQSRTRSLSEGAEQIGAHARYVAHVVAHVVRDASSSGLDWIKSIGSNHRLPVREHEPVSVQKLALQLTFFRVTLDAFETGLKSSKF